MRCLNIYKELKIFPGVDEKLVIVDDEIVYWGGLLSNKDKSEFMVRSKSPKFAEKLGKFKNLDTVVEAPTQWESDVEISRHELPTINSGCRKCGGNMIPKSGKFGVFYSCANWPNCKQSGEDVSENHLSTISRLINVHCDGCQIGTPMNVKTHYKDAWLQCSSCGYRRRIIIKPE